MQHNKYKYAKNLNDYYNEYISPRIKRIDMFLKTKESPYSILSVAKLLSLSAAEVKDIIKKEDIKTLDDKSFFLILWHGSSNICNIIKKEAECKKSDGIYTKTDISYIYNVSEISVTRACERLKTDVINQENISEIFSLIPPPFLLKAFYIPVYRKNVNL